MSDENTNWFDALPEPMRTMPEVERAKSLDSFLDNMKTTRDYVSNAIRVPTENAGEADIQAFYEKVQKHAPNLMPTPDMANPDSVKEVLRRMGLPEEATGYESVEGDTLQFIDGQLENLKQWAHEAGLTRQQFKAFAEKVGADTYSQISQGEQANQQELKTLADEWGLSAEAKYKETVNFAKQSEAPKSFIDALENKQVDSATVFWLNGLAKTMF